MMESTNISERNYGLDLLRIVCMIMIPVLHILGHGGVLANTAPLSFNHYAYWFLEILCFGSVNMFAIISGYVSYGRKTKFSNLLLLWLRILFYSLLINVIIWITNAESFTFKALGNAFIPTIKSTWWYWTMYAGLFILSPFLNKGIELIKRNYATILLIIIFVIFSCLPTLTENENAFALNYGYSLIWLIVLYIFGALIKKFDYFKKVNNCKLLLILLSAFILTFLFKIVIEFSTYKSKGEPLYGDYLIEYISPTILIMSISLFLLFSRINIRSLRFRKVLPFISQTCFSVYIIHDHPLVRQYVISNRFTFIDEMNVFLGLLSVFGLSITIYLMCTLIDIPRELLFKALKLKTKLNTLESRIIKD